MKNNGHIRSQFCTCHGSWTGMTCAKLWPDWIITIKYTAKEIFTRFELWAHKPFAKRSPGMPQHTDDYFPGEIHHVIFIHQNPSQAEEELHKTLVSHPSDTEGLFQYKDTISPELSWWVPHNISGHPRFVQLGLFCVCAQPMRDDVTM